MIMSLRIGNLKEVIKFLKRGEKYEDMWYDFKDKYGSNGSEIGSIMGKFEEKYINEEEK